MLFLTNKCYTIMSYYVQSYLTDAKLLKKIYGSKNPLLLQKLTKDMTDDLDDLDDYYEKDVDHVKNAPEVLADIINGVTRFPEITFMYSLVYEKLCGHVGKKVYPPNDEYSTDYYLAVPKETKHKAFMPIPFTKDYPEVYSISYDELPAEKERFLKLTERKGADAEELAEEKAEFEFIFDKAAKDGKDLVFFLYEE